MFIINITYKVSLEVAKEYFDEHIAFVKEQFTNGNFIVAGKKEPRDGGVVFSNIEDKAELEALLMQDPFVIHDVATFEIINFVPTKASKEFEFFLK